jgi:predicted 2-oxoglutarate/Fe(II)-dependent dioxygenase YbiX
MAEGFLDAATCRRIRAAMDGGALEAAEILEDGAAIDVDVRRAATVDVDATVITEVESRLDERRHEIARFFGTRLTEREGANFLRYEPGGFYLPHVDRAEIDAWPGAARRQIAVVVFLNSEVTGGALHLIDARTEIEPREGRLVAFDAGMPHEVLPVVHGTRDVVVDWFY